MRGLFIDGNRSGYSPDQCGKTVTVNEMIEILMQFKEWYDAGNLPIFLYNDNGYTYGEISEDTINVGDYSSENGVEFEE